MLSIDFTPAPTAARASQRIRVHALTEARLVLSNGEQAILALVIPISILLAARLAGQRFGVDLASVAPSVLALATWSTAFTSLAIATGFERRYNVLERLAATPLGKGGILIGKALAFTLVGTGQLSVLTILAVVMGWRPSFDAMHSVVAALSLVVAACAFAGGALSIAGTLRPEVTLALANLVYLAGIGLGIMIPLRNYPEALQPIVGALPTAALGEAMRFGTWWSIPVLLAWAVLTLGIARKVFQWTS